MCTAKGTGCSSAAHLALFLEQRLVLWGLVSFGGHKFEMPLQEGGVISLTVLPLPVILHAQVEGSLH